MRLGSILIVFLTERVLVAPARFVLGRPPRAAGWALVTVIGAGRWAASNFATQLCGLLAR